MGMVIFVIGKPGSGKTEARRHIEEVASNLNHDVKIASVDELDIIYEISDSLPTDSIERTTGGQLLIRDRCLLSKSMEVVRSRVLELLTSTDILLVEFSRAQYLKPISMLASEITHSFVILYVDTPFKTCVRRNEERNSPSNNQYVPKQVLEAYYRTDDIEALKKRFRTHIQILDNASEDRTKLKRKLALLTKEQLMPCLFGGKLRPKVRAFWKECIVAGWLLACASFFLWLGYWCIAAKTGGAERDPIYGYTLLLFGIATAGGGLGSTLYCIRAFHSYYMEGLFNFDKLKWWYFFRPLTGAILAIACLALIRGQVVVLTSSNIKADMQSYMTIYGIAFLAGFGTEQVVERLRKASKALFGEEGDKGKDVRLQ